MAANTQTDKVHVTVHKSGKMEGFLSISTSTTGNEFCSKMKTIEGCVCGKCYARKYESYRPSMEIALNHNNEKLAGAPLHDDQIPILNALYVRINSFGELINEMHAENIFRICEKNPETTFVIWTKRLNLLPVEKRPVNLKVIYSNPIADHVIEYEPGKGYDGVFNVISKGYAELTRTEVNCGGKRCKDCMKCYSGLKSGATIIELFK